MMFGLHGLSCVRVDVHAGRGSCGDPSPTPACVHPVMRCPASLSRRRMRSEAFVTTLADAFSKKGIAAPVVIAESPSGRQPANLVGNAAINPSLNASASIIM